MKELSVREMKRIAWDSICDNLEQPVLISALMLLICLTAFLVGELLLTALQFYFPEPFEDAYIISVYTVVRVCVSFVIITPFISGAIFWYAIKYRNGSCPVKCVLCCYRFSKRFAKAVWINLLAVLPAALTTVIYVMTLRLMYTLCTALYGSASFTAAALLLGAAAAILTCTYVYMFVWLFLRYSMSNLIFALDPDTRTHEILKLSAYFMSGNKWPAVRLLCSYIPWLPLFLLGFPAMLIIPYVIMSLTVYFDNVLAELTEGNTIDHFKERIAKHER